MLSPTQPPSLASFYFAYKVDIFVCFLSLWYLEPETVVAIELCGPSDALFPSGEETTQWTGLFGSYPLTKEAGCKQEWWFGNKYFAVLLPTQHSFSASETGLVSGLSDNDAMLCFPHFTSVLRLGGKEGGTAES